MSTELLVALVSAASVMVTNIFGPVITDLLKKWFKPKKTSDPVKENIKTDVLIADKLEEISVSFHTSRIWICQFHNGGYYPTGKSMQKLSMIYEISNSSNSIQQQFQSIPTGIFSKALNYLSDGNIISITDFEIDDAFGLDAFGNQIDAESTYIFPLITIDSKFIGFVGLSFNEIRPLSNIEKNGIEIEVNSIAGVLRAEQIKK